MRDEYSCPKDMPCEHNKMTCNQVARLDETSNSYFASTLGNDDCSIDCPFTNFLDELKTASHEHRQVTDVNVFDTEGNLI